MSVKSYTGVNIQYPISRLILDMSKTIETRKYPIPKSLINQELALIETPGKMGKFKSRVVAIIKFTENHQYKTKKEFYNDTKFHRVTRNSVWAWNDGDRWGWSVKIIKILETPQEVTKRKGIKFTKDVKVKL